MRVFISWSGGLSKELAEVFRKWLPSALQYVKPYFTPADIEKGSKWATEIFKELSASSICIIVLTRDNLNSSWIMFEAGAISCTIERARVCPIIFDLEETDIQGPLAQFQATKFLKNDIRKLFNTINAAAPTDQKLQDSVAETVFEKWWPDLESATNGALTGHKATISTKDIRSERELIEELLLLTRKIAADAETKKSPASPLPPIKYETTLYKRMAQTIGEFFDQGGYDNENLKAVKSTIDGLLADVQQRTLPSSTKAGLVKDLSALTKIIVQYIADDGETKAAQ